MDTYTFYTIAVVSICAAHMWHRYQWRKMWEAYYKRPLPPDQEDYAAPNGKMKKESEEKHGEEV